jgi:hypothetical protein
VSNARVAWGGSRSAKAVCCVAVALGALATVISPALAAAACPNEPARTGFSAQLPDCRAYELVTPADSGGREITSNHYGPEPNAFATDLGSQDGGSLVFNVYHGGLNEFPESTGTSDVYESVRSAGGWKTVRRLSPTGEEAIFPDNGGISPDHQYMFEHVAPIGGTGGSGGTLAPTSEASYVGLPDGTFELLGKGSLGVDPLANGKLITANGSHVIFVSSLQLEPDAPSGLTTIYDRSIGGPTRVVSLLPGNVTPSEEARYLGVSADGSTVAFSIAGTLYVRVDDSSTEEVTSGEATFAGLTVHGERLFYMREGNPFAFDVSTGTTAQLTSTGDAQLVNIAPDGARAYFVSFSQLGGEGLAGEPNLYVWHAGSQAVNFVATLSGEDLSGFPALNTWTGHVVGEEPPMGPGADPSRLTPDGSVMLFESAAKLTAYENEGRTEIYRYDDLDRSLICLSCNPGVAPTGDARLENLVVEQEPQFVWSQNIINNLSEDGNTAFFETSESLVSRDVNGSNDIYEWSIASGIPTLSLISSGQTPSYPGLKSTRAPNVVIAITPDGQNVFFSSVDPLVPGAGTGGVPAIYDARVNGGFPEEPTAACEGEGCQPASPSQSVPTPASAQFAGRGNVMPRQCPKGKKAKGKKCVQKKQHKKKKNKKKKHGHHHGGHKKGAGK